MKKLLIKNATILSMRKKNEILENYSILIKNDTISKIDKVENIQEDIHETIDASGKIVIPGLINAHTHAAMTLLRGYADDYPLKEWLEKYIWPAEAKYMNANTIRLGTQLAILEMLAGGTTFFNDMYFWEEEVGNIAVSAGIKAYLCEGIIDYPNKTYDVKLKFDKTEDLIQKYKNNPLIKVGIAPHTPYTCTKKTLIKAKDFAEKYGIIYHIHIAETKEEAKLIPDNNKSPVQYLNELDILNEKTVAVHCVYLDDIDRNILFEKKVGVVHNAVSNHKLASGSAEIYKLINKGIKVGLGTDGATSNNNLDMFKEMNLAALTQKVISKNPQVLSAYETLYLATMGSAKVLGVATETGSIEIGKKADLVILNPNKPHSIPLYNPFSYIAYSALSSDVETTIVNGRILYHKGEYKTLDENKIMWEINKFAEKVKFNVS